MEIPNGGQDIVYPDEKDSLEGVTFYYNREKRLESASQNVKDYYSGKFKKPPKGLFKVLVATKELRFIFTTLCLVMMVCIIVMISNRFENSSSFENASAELVAFSFEDTIYTSIKVSPKNSQKFDSMNSIEASGSFRFIDNTKETIYTIDFNQTITENDNFIRTTCKDYDIINVEADLKIGDKTAKLFCKVKKQ